MPQCSKSGELRVASAAPYASDGGDLSIKFCNGTTHALPLCQDSSVSACRGHVEVEDLSSEQHRDHLLSFLPQNLLAPTTWHQIDTRKQFSQHD